VYKTSLVCPLNAKDGYVTKPA